MAYDDDDLLRIVRAERQRSVGFENDTDLTTARERSLEYIKGVMTDMPSLPNRSQAVTSDVSDAIETLLPDLIEIFTGGEDVATFQPTGEEDEEGAQQETDYVNHVVFNENPGWLVLYTMFKDALQIKTGIVKWWMEDVPPPAPKAYTGMPEASVALAMAEGDVLNLRPSEQAGPEPLYDFEMPRQGPKKRVRIAAVPPEDFTVAADTISLKDTAYCAMRSRPRAQDLLARGISPDIVDMLPAYGLADDQMVQARDTAYEHENYGGNSAVPELRIVETIEHFVRLVDGDQYKIFRIETGNNEQVLIEREEVDAIHFAAITPYIVTHRFYGLSVADLLMQIQRITTALTRAALDNTYFALNQRMEVSERDMSGRTIGDLLRNEPGVPVLSKTGNAVRAISSGGLSFDPFQSLEYFKTVAEQRTGIVRNAQGINSDALHDTAKGAQVMMQAAQKRVRMIARIFAETGIKELFLGVHAMLRQAGGVAEKVRLRNKWVATDPTGWGERNDMTIEVGVGSAGKEQDLITMRSVLDLQAQGVAAQGGQLNGPLVTAKNLYNAATRFVEKAGIKQPEAFFSDPDQQKPEAPAGPDPALIAAQQEAQAQQQAEQAKAMLEAAKLQQAERASEASFEIETAKLQLEQAKLQLDAEDRDHRRRMEVAAFEIRVQQEDEDRQTNAAIAIAKINAEFNSKITAAEIKADTERLRAETDLVIQASEQRHGQEIRDDAHIQDVIDRIDEPDMPGQDEAE